MAVIGEGQQCSCKMETMSMERWKLSTMGQSALNDHTDGRKYLEKCQKSEELFKKNYQMLHLVKFFLFSYFLLAEFTNAKALFELFCWEGWLYLGILNRNF